MVFTLDQAYNWMAIIVFILRSIRNDATLHGWMDFVTKSITWRWGSNITMSYYGTECPNLGHSGLSTKMAPIRHPINKMKTWSNYIN